MRARLLVVLSLVIACNEIAGINEPLDKDGTGTSTTTPAADGGAPSDTGTSSGEGASRFSGAWTGSGEVTSCDGTDPGVAVDIDIRAKTETTLELTDGPCKLQLTIAGNVARGKAQSCRPPNTALGVDYSSVTFTLGDETHYETEGFIVDLASGEKCAFVQKAIVTRGGN